MKDDLLHAALRSIGINRYWIPAREYHGDRPNTNWPAFLGHLKRQGYNPTPKLRTLCK
jgi:hypothetical protein